MEEWLGGQMNGKEDGRIHGWEGERRDRVFGERYKD